MAKRVKNRAALEEIILLLYNTLSSFFGQDQGFKILRAFTLETDCPEEGLTIHQGQYRPIAIKLKTANLNPDKNKTYWNWLTGYSSISHPYAIIVHEFGHLIDLYHLKTFQERINVDICSGLDNQFSNFTNQTNVMPLINSWFNFCGYQCNNYFDQSDQTKYEDFNSKHDQQKLDYCIIQTITLVQCILSNIEHFQLPADQEERMNLIFKILPYIFINSDYGGTNFFELQAEGFQYWLLTPMMRA